MAASYLIQGAFKETIEALFVLAFAVGLHELGRGALVGAAGLRGQLSAVPLAALAVGAVYAYSFPGLAVAGRRRRALGGDRARDHGEELPAGGGRRARSALGARGGGGARGGLRRLGPRARQDDRLRELRDLRPRPVPGLGNLFNPISPLEALGIWPSGDFRLDPGDGAVPAAGFYLGELLGLLGPRATGSPGGFGAVSGPSRRPSRWRPRCSPTRISRGPRTRPRSRS